MFAYTWARTSLIKWERTGVPKTYKLVNWYTYLGEQSLPFNFLEPEIM